MTEEQHYLKMVASGRQNSINIMRGAQLAAKTNQELEDHMFIMKVMAFNILATIGFNMTAQNIQGLPEFMIDVKKGVLGEIDFINTQDIKYKQAGEE